MFRLFSLSLYFWHVCVSNLLICLHHVCYVCLFNVFLNISIILYLLSSVSFFLFFIFLLLFIHIFLSTICAMDYLPLCPLITRTYVSIHPEHPACICHSWYQVCLSHTRYQVCMCHADVHLVALQSNQMTLPNGFHSWSLLAVTSEQRHDNVPQQWLPLVIFLCSVCLVCVW